MPDTAYLIAFDDEAVEEEFYDDVVSLTVDENTATGSSFRLQLATTRQDDGSWVYLEDARLALFTRVSIQIGFSGGSGLTGALGDSLGANGTGGNDGLEPVFDGFITDVEVTLGSEPDSAQIEVSGLDSSVLMSLEEKIVTWTDLRDSDIVKQIVGDVYRITIQTEATPTVHRKNDTTIVQRGSDLDFVRDLARRNGLEFYFETDKTSAAVIAYFRAPQLDGTPQPDLAIQFGDESNLRRFTVRLSGQRPLNVRTEQMDVRANGPKFAQVGTMKLAALGDQAADTLIRDRLRRLVKPRRALAQVLVLGPPASDPTELTTLAQAVRDEAGWLITAEGEINGDAYQHALRPRRLVFVKGAGTAYSGKYYVTRVVHALTGDGEYTQTFEARRNARGLDESEQFDADGLAGLAEEPAQ